MRDYDSEFQNNQFRQYAYDFDSIVRRYMMRTLSPFFSSGKALELGCFEGESTKLFSDHFHDLTVLEASGDLIAIARTRVPDSVSFIHGTIESASLDAIYDSIFLVHTLEHLDDPIASLARIKSWLSPGGKLFLVVPNAHAPSRGHRCTYSLDTLEHDARAAELRVQTRGGIFFKPFANFQFDMLIRHQVVDQAYLDGCYELGMHYPELTSSIYIICTA